MGILRRFVCRDCGFDAKCQGGLGALMSGPTVTIWCEACRVIEDVFCWTKEDLAGMDKGHRWSVANPRPSTMHQTLPQCSENAGHRIGLWTGRDPCPKCGGEMKLDPTFLACVD